MRSVAIYGDKLFVPTRDAHVIALDARTGAVVWDRTMADSKLGYHFGSGPLIVNGKVVVGVQGCQHYKNDVCFIAALDAQDGREVWRTSTIARPGSPAARRGVIYRSCSGPEATRGLPAATIRR